MKKLFKVTGAIALTAALLSVSVFTAACDNGTTETHEWGAWQHSEEGHWRVCADCGAEDYGAHTDGTCKVCAYGFKVLALGYIAGGDTAHADFAQEANIWFPEQGEQLGFTYTYGGSDFSALTDENLEEYDLVIFLNNMPGGTQQQEAFRRYMEGGGAFMAFHSAAFAMWDDRTPPTEWYDWYHNTLLRSGEYGYGSNPENPSMTYWNTWNPTSEPLKIETRDHFATADLEGDEFISAPCEWYAWANDLMNDPEVTVLLTLNPTQENPAGDQPDKSKPHEIWYDGHHPIAWANNSYNMVYMNWGHNLQSYNNGAEGTKSSTFSSKAQNQFMINAMFGLVQKSMSAK